MEVLHTKYVDVMPGRNTDKIFRGGFGTLTPVLEVIRKENLYRLEQRCVTPQAVKLVKINKQLYHCSSTGNKCSCLLIGLFLTDELRDGRFCTRD